ncbi:OmpA family protein [Myroides odoratus]|uniref:OmpA family protein n=1 Tax=Myroides odoratus TaxID=256 RepID=UPI003341E757
MMVRELHIGLLSLFISMGAVGYSQVKKEKLANASYDDMAYANAIELYENLAKKGYVNTSILQKLGDSYYFNGKLAQANQWYTELFEGEYKGKDLTVLPSEYYYRYAQTLKGVEDYKKSLEYMNAFAAMEQSDSRTALYNKNRDYLSHIENHSDLYEVKALSINTEYSDYGGSMLGDDLVFTSARATSTVKDSQLHAWTNESYTSLYRVKVSPEGLGQPERFSTSLDSQVNDATAVFTADGNTMYFTRNNAKHNGKSKQNKEHTSMLKIYKAVKQGDGLWGQVEALPINSDNYNTAHPALSPDGKWLYFASDRPESIGESDLYRVALYTNGGYGPVESLGMGINTAGRESFPFISSDSQLYFSSNGHPGLGGLDVFVSKLYPDGTLGPVVNMGKPINSSMDDFGFYFDPKEKKGFLSSNRAGGHGSDDIYLVAEKPCTQIIEGKVYNKQTQAVLSDARVIISDAQYQYADTLRTNNRGYYNSELLNCGNKYRIKVEHPSYNTVEVVFNADPKPGIKTMDIGLEETIIPIDIDDDLFKTLDLEPIYFDFDSAVVRYDASIELMKVVELMKKYPKLKIDVRAHSDSKGNDAYNLKLSDRRAKATIDWMVKQGIAANRLSGRGYGETRLLNHCSNGVRCSELEHQENRRSEFIVIEK